MAFVFLRQTGKAFLISVKRLISFLQCISRRKCLKNSINCCRYQLWKNQEVWQSPAIPCYIYSLFPFLKKKREWLFNIKGKNYLKSETFIEWMVLKNHRILVILKDFLGGQFFYCVGKYDPRTLSGSC